MIKNNHTFLGVKMPTIIPFKLGVKETTELEFNFKQTGIRKYLRIPYVFSFPYFSGTAPKLEIEITNHSKDIEREITCTGRLYNLLPRITMQESGEVQNDASNATVKIAPSRKGTATLLFGNLSQPGNYILKIECSENGKSVCGQRDIMYFDALPKDGSTFNVAIITVSTLIGFIFGLISGWLING